MIELKEKLREKAENRRSWYILICIALLVTFFCSYVKWLADDIAYQYNFIYHFTGVLQPIDSLYDIVVSQYYHYLSMNGRIVAHSIVQLFDGLLGQTIFSICNGVIYVLFIRVAMWLCGVTMQNWRGTLSIGLSVLVFLSLPMTPAFQMYIWMFLIVAVFTKLFLDYRASSRKMIAALALFSVIAGNSHDSITSGVCVALCIYVTVHFRRITSQQWVMLIFFFLGFLVNYVSPGTQHRAEYFGTDFDIEWRTVAFILMLRDVPMLYVLAATTIYNIVIKKRRIREIYASNELWWGIWVGCLLFNIVMGFSGGRAVLGEEFSAIVLTISQTKRKSLSNFWLCVLAIISVVFVFFQWQISHRVNTLYDSMLQQYKENPEGIVFLDIDYTTPLSSDKLFTHLIKPDEWADEAAATCASKDLTQHLSRLTGTNHPLRLFPEEMRCYICGDEFSRKPNAAIEYTDKMWILVQSKENPAPFKIHYKREIPFFVREYEPRDFDLSSQPIVWENAEYRAVYTSGHIFNELYPATYSTATP